MNIYMKIQILYFLLRLSHVIYILVSLYTIKKTKYTECVL